MTVDDFIARWTDREGGAERANYVMFLSELCDVLGVARPEPAGATREYVLEAGQSRLPQENGRIGRSHLAGGAHRKSP